MTLPFRPDPAPLARRRNTFLTREEVVGAAALILERDGYDALNMRAVARVLGVQAAALYRYVEGRGELDDLLFDHLMADCAPPAPGQDWREDLAMIASAWRARLVGRRDATRIALGQVSIGPNMLPLMESALSALRRAGLSDDDVVEAYQTITLFVHGFATSEASYRSLAAKAGDAPRFCPFRPEWAEAFPTVAALADKLSAPAGMDGRFALGLAALIAAIDFGLRAKVRSAAPFTG